MEPTQELQVRELRNKDIGTVIRLINKLELKDKLGSGIKYSDLAFLVLESYDKAEQDLNTFFGDFCGVSGEEYAEMPIDTIFTIFSEWKKKPGKLASFFQLLSDYLKLKYSTPSTVDTDQAEAAS